jgi:hypothetical protein
MLTSGFHIMVIRVKCINNPRSHRRCLKRSWNSWNASKQSWNIFSMSTYGPRYVYSDVAMQVEPMVRSWLAHDGLTLCMNSQCDGQPRWIYTFYINLTWIFIHQLASVFFGLRFFVSTSMYIYLFIFGTIHFYVLQPVSSTNCLNLFFPFLF